MTWTPNRRVALTAVCVFALDQIAKSLVLKFLHPFDEWVVVDGFFKFVRWGNSGAAWSLFHGQNEALAIVSLVAFLCLFLWRHFFFLESVAGQLALGLVFGGIVGNLYDRLDRHQVVDFLRFYMYRRSGEEIGFPAFNVADSAICIGVGLLIILSWRRDHSGLHGGEG